MSASGSAAWLSALRQLFIFGDHESAYLGYVSLLNDGFQNRGVIYYELGLISLARGNNDKAKEWFTRALKEAPLQPEEKEACRQELEYIKAGKMPDWLQFDGSGSITSLQIHAVTLLYNRWTAEGERTKRLLELSVEDLLAASGRVGTVSIAGKDDKTYVTVAERRIDEIEILGNTYTKQSAVLQELAYLQLDIFILILFKNFNKNRFGFRVLVIGQELESLSHILCRELPNKQNESNCYE